MVTHHLDVVSEVSKYFIQQTIPQMMIVVCFISIGIRRVSHKFCKGYYKDFNSQRKKLKKQHLELSPFFQTLPGSIQKSWYADVLHQKRSLGINHLKFQTIEALRTAHNNGEHMITDIPNYDMLYNLEYRDRFGFVTLEFR